MDNTIQDARKAITDLKPFISSRQLFALSSAFHYEEKQFFFDKVVEMSLIIANMSESYQQDGKGDEAMVYLHYFRGGMDWYITEKDAGSEDDHPKDKGKQFQAFGFADLGYGGELGYISIAELIENNIEIDLYFTPKPLGEIKAA